MGLFAISAREWGFNKALTVTNFCRVLIVLNFSDFKPRIIFKLLLYLSENIPIFVDALLHFKTKEDFIFCIDNAKIHLKAVL